VIKEFMISNTSPEKVPKGFQPKFDATSVLARWYKQMWAKSSRDFESYLALKSI
jgi:hypothetical protein